MHLRAARLGVLSSAFALASVLLAGCFAEEKVAGGDDFPNSVETLGKQGAASASGSSDSADWNGYEDAPSTPPDAYDSTSVPDSVPGDSVSALGKVSTPPDGRVPPGLEIAGAVRSLVSLSDPISGLHRAVRVQTLLGIEARDTTWYRVQLLPAAKRVVRVSGVVTYASGRSERFVFEDADGDSILTPRAGSANLARVRFVVNYALGRVEERTLTVAAGSDLSFGSRADNVLRASETVHRVGADTVYRASLRPVGSDSVVFDPNRASGFVDVEQMVSALGVRTTLAYRAILHADTSRNRATRFRRVVETPAGTTETVALGRDSAADFAPGDTGRVRVSFVSASLLDTLASSVSSYRVVLSDTAGPGSRAKGNRLLRIDRDQTFRMGAATASRYRLTPASPLSPGGSTRSGAVSLRVDLRAGGWVELEGASSPTGLSGIWTTSTGKTGSVHFDAAGNIVSAP